MINLPEYSICEGVISSPEELSDWWPEMAEGGFEGYEEYQMESGLYEGLDNIITVD